MYYYVLQRKNICDNFIPQAESFLLWEETLQLKNVMNTHILSCTLLVFNVKFLPDSLLK